MDKKKVKVTEIYEITRTRTVPQEEASQEHNVGSEPFQSKVFSSPNPHYKKKKDT
jgi:hypothetical protein